MCNGAGRRSGNEVRVAPILSTAFAADDTDHYCVGGETGVDLGALEAGFPCRGLCPTDRAAEDGPISARYPSRNDNVWHGLGVRYDQINSLGRTSRRIL